MKLSESNFPFITNAVLRGNIDMVFDHILVLTAFGESKDYSKEAKSSFRKSIIIHTAAIVEGLLFYLLDIKFKEDDIEEFYSSWELEEKKVLYVVEEGRYEVIAGNFVKKPGKGAKKKLNLAQITNYLREKKIINNEIESGIDKIRRLRNEQHIGLHETIKTYNKSDLEEAFSIAREVKEFVRNNL